MDIVIDCNVFVSAALGSTTCALVLEKAFTIHQVFYSNETLSELIAVFERPQFKKATKKAHAIISTIELLGIRVKADKHRVALPDPDDVIYLQVAIAAGANLLITGNQKHFPQGSCGDVRVLSPRMFLDET